MTRDWYTDKFIEHLPMREPMKITNADIITAFDEHAIGTKVLPGHAAQLWSAIKNAVVHERNFPDNPSNVVRGMQEAEHLEAQ